VNHRFQAFAFKMQRVPLRLGSLIAGRISDWYIATSPGGAVGKRIQVVMVYMFGVAAMLLAFKAVPAGYPIAQAIIVFMIGFFLYGPQMLIGLCGAVGLCKLNSVDA
jgi:OPA family sugar phosphate sensor protein UhpC-like MFS transporter